MSDTIQWTRPPQGCLVSGRMYPASNYRLTVSPGIVDISNRARKMVLKREFQLKLRLQHLYREALPASNYRHLVEL